MKRSLTFVLGVATALAAVFVLGGPARPRGTPAVAADVPASTSGVVVDGTGTATGTPDVLRVVLGVSVHRADVSSALSEANKRQARLRDALITGGVADKDLQTSDVSIGSYYGNNGRANGYQVSETLTAKLRNLTRAGRLLTDAVTAGGNETVLQGVSFALEDNAALLSTARDNAFADAQAKATRYAHLSGRTLGAVQLITETVTPAAPQPYQSFDGAAGRALAAVPINAGTTDLTVSVTVRWALQ